jgi:hypothetical protein
VSVPLWLRLDVGEMAMAAAGLVFAGSLLVAKFLGEIAAHRSTVDASASEAIPLASDAGPRTVGSSVNRPDADQSEGDTSGSLVLSVAGSTVDSPTQS